MLGGCFSISRAVFSMQFGRLPHTGSWAPCQMTPQSLHTTAVFVSRTMHITESLELIIPRQVSSIGWSCRRVARRCRKTPVSPLFLILWNRAEGYQIPQHLLVYLGSARRWTSVRTSDDFLACQRPYRKRG